MKKCSKCDNLLKDDAKFCPKCGTNQLEAVSGQPEPPKQPAASRKPEVPKQPAASRKPEVPKRPAASRKPETAQAAPKKKSVVPFVIICAVLILAMAGGTGIYLWKLKQANDEQELMAIRNEWSDGEEDDEEVSETEEPEEDPDAETVPETIPDGETTLATEPPTTADAAMPTVAPTTAAVPETAAMPTVVPTTAYVPETTAAQGSYTTMYVVNCNEFITLRTSPSTSAAGITRIPLGSAVSYVSTAENGFYKIIYNGQTGYSLASYLSEDSYSSTYQEPSVVTYPTMYVVNCNEFITLRTSDSTSASEITKIPLGSAVSYVSTAGNGFYKIIYNGKTGYALASYLSY